MDLAPPTQNDISTLLRNVKLGVLTVVPGNRIHHEYSSYLPTMFGVDHLADQDVVESLFSRSNFGVEDKMQLSAAIAAILGGDARRFAANEHLLPREMLLQAERGGQHGGQHGGQRDGQHGGQKIVQLEWSPVVGAQGVVEKLLLVTQDVTLLRELEVAAGRQKEELDIVAQIIRLPLRKFNDFVDSARHLITANRRALEASTRHDTQVIATLSWNMRALLDHARTYELSHVTDAAQLADQTYEELRQGSDASWDVEWLQTELDAVEAAVNRYITVNEDKLARKGRASDLLTTRGCFVSNQQMLSLRELAAAVVKAHPDADCKRLQQAIDNLGLIPLERLVTGAVDSLSSLANELKKPAPAVEIVHGELSFNSRFAEALKSSFMHLLRNCLDHGIESPAERRQAHKSMQGRVRFACLRQGDDVELRVSDDGRGLALHELYEKGLAAGMFTVGERPSREAIAEVIFTQASGQGVGMEAVRTFLGEQGATIRIALGQGEELGFTPFEFVIDIPPTAYRHVA